MHLNMKLIEKRWILPTELLRVFIFFFHVEYKFLIIVKHLDKNQEAYEEETRGITNDLCDSGELTSSSIYITRTYSDFFRYFGK